MSYNNKIQLITAENIKDKIYTIRCIQVMLDSDLAMIYGYSTKAFNQQVKNNIEKFEDDFRFQLTKYEVEQLRSKFLTANLNSMSRTLPYVFTEQGIYMLMTVLKGELATKQSLAFVRTFKMLKDIVTQKENIISVCSAENLIAITNKHTTEIEEIINKIVTKDELAVVIRDFANQNLRKEYLILDGELVEADIAYSQIFSCAKHSVYYIDNYISLKSLILMKSINKKVDITIFSDNISKDKLTKMEYDDFVKEYNLNINFKKTDNRFHDRFIIIDYGTSNCCIYHCGSSSKDCGNKVTAISKIENIEIYKPLVNTITENHRLILK